MVKEKEDDGDSIVPPFRDGVLFPLLRLWVSFSPIYDKERMVVLNTLIIKMCVVRPYHYWEGHPFFFLLEISERIGKGSHFSRIDQEKKNLLKRQLAFGDFI